VNGLTIELKTLQEQALVLQNLANEVPILDAEIAKKEGEKAHYADLFAKTVTYKLSEK
jgi:hypothetical protein